MKALRILAYVLPLRSKSSCRLSQVADIPPLLAGCLNEFSGGRSNSELGSRQDGSYWNFRYFSADQKELRCSRAECG